MRVYDPEDAVAALDLIAELSSDVVLRVDLQGIVTYISPSIRRYGHDPAVIVGGSGLQLIHPDDRERVAANTAALLRGEHNAGAERQHRFLRADGEWLWIEGNPRVLYGPNGEPRGFLNIFRDVTQRRALERKAIEEAEQFEAAFRHAAIGKALVGLDGRFLRVNEAFCRLVGYPEPQMLALDFQTLTHPDDLNTDLEHLRRLTAGEIENYRMDKRYRRADGHLVWVRLAVSMVTNPDGSPKHYLAEVEDQTERRGAEAALRESEARWRLIAENTTDMIVMSDLDGRTTYASPAVRRAGYEPADLLQGTFGGRVHPDDLATLRAAFERLAAGGPPERVRWRGRHGLSGEWLWLESNPSLLHDPETGRPSGLLDVIRDVTLQVQQEQALAEARAEAEAAAAVKAQFLANMSHEIRTPLTAVVGFTGLLRDDPTVRGAAAGYVARIAGAGNALLAIVNDILDFSKLEAGKVEVRPRPTDLAAVGRETLAVFASQAEQRGLRLEFVADPRLPAISMIDPDRLRQMLVNLIGNAVKFTDVGSVSLQVLPATAIDGVEFVVADTGPGLDPEQQALLFQRFTQIDGSMTRRHGGAGLGLAITKGLAEAMGGTIALESRAGEGAIFRLELPAPAAELPPQIEAAPALAAVDGVRVFVVDDNPVNRELTRKVLEAAGADVNEAASGEEALERLAVTPVDVVLMDLRMPGLDGHETTARLRAGQGPNRDIPVLAFTADVDVQRKGDLAAFDGVVHKPISPVEMYGAVAAATAWDDGSGAEDSHAVA